MNNKYVKEYVILTETDYKHIYSDRDEDVVIRLIEAVDENIEQYYETTFIWFKNQLRIDSLDILPLFYESPELFKWLLKKQNKQIKPKDLCNYLDKLGFKNVSKPNE